jgi:hypothetical protein
MSWFIIYVSVCALFGGFVRAGYGASRFWFLKACGRVISSSLVEIYVFGGMLRLQLQHKGAALFLLVYREDGCNLCARNFGSFLPD